MPLDGEQLDELLSGFLDGQLSDDELKLVQRELSGRESVRDRFEQLSRSRDELRQFFRSVKEESKPSSQLAARVIAQAQRQALQAGLPEDHHVRIPEQSEIVSFAQGSSIPWKRIGQWAAGMSALAAAVLLCVSLLPNAQDGPTMVAGGDNPAEPLIGQPDLDVATLEDSQPARSEIEGDPVEAEAIEDVPLQYVSGIDFKNHIVLVVDLEISHEAMKRREFERILRRHGILEKKPIVADPRVKQAVADTRATLPDDDEIEISEALIYMMRADYRLLGAALDEIYANPADFPRVAFDIAIDNPSARLMETIARSTGSRFSVHRTFAAPVSTEASPEMRTPFPGVRKPVRFVSSAKRQQGFSEQAQMFASSEESLTTVLIFVREPL